MGHAHYPTQTAAWADFDNDGDLDVYIGNENLSGSDYAPCQLFRNNGDGTFADVADAAGVTNGRFTKGVAWGDYDDDGLPDLYVSNLAGDNRLYHNEGDGTFVDVAGELGVTGPHKSFPVWFWDFDNDGHLDLFVSQLRMGPGHPRGHGLQLPRSADPVRARSFVSRKRQRRLRRRRRVTEPDPHQPADGRQLRRSR